MSDTNGDLFSQFDDRREAQLFFITTADRLEHCFRRAIQAENKDEATTQIRTDINLIYVEFLGYFKQHFLAGDWNDAQRDGIDLVRNHMARETYEAVAQAAAARLTERMPHLRSKLVEFITVAREVIAQDNAESIANDVSALLARAQEGQKGQGK